MSEGVEFNAPLDTVISETEQKVAEGLHFD